MKIAKTNQLGTGNQLVTQCHEPVMHMHATQTTAQT